MSIKELSDVRDKLLINKLHHGKDPSGYVDGVLDMFNEIKKIMLKKEEVQAK